MQNKKVNMKTFIKNYMKAVGVVCACTGNGIVRSRLFI